MSDGGRREENDPSLISVLLCFIASERQVRWQRQWTQYYLFWNSEKWRASAPLPSSWTLINSHPYFYQKPIMSLIQSRIEPDISFNSSHSPIMHCWNNVSFISVAIHLLVCFVFTHSSFVSEWEFLEVLTQRGSGVELQTLVRSDVVFIKLQTALQLTRPLVSCLNRAVSFTVHLVLTSCVSEINFSFKGHFLHL